MIGALDAEALHDVVVRACGTSLPHAALRRVHEVSGGNPFFAIELARLRRRGDNVPVLMLTAHGSIDDKVDCFGIGADDYVVKPFDARELVARIKALIRRQSGEKSARLICGDLQYLSDKREFRHNDLPLALRRRCQIAISDSNSARSAMRRSRHCLRRTPISISTMFNQLACLGV